MAIAGSPAVRRPLPDVAVHLAEPPRVRLEGADTAGACPLRAFFAGVKRLPGVRLVAPPIARLGARAGGILPFGFSRQAIEVPGEGAQPCGIGAGAFPAYANYGMLVCLRKAGVRQRTGRL